MKEIIIPGYFTENQAKTLVKALEGKTIMNFRVTYGNACGNCTVTVSTDYKTSKKELQEFVISYAFSELARLTK